LKKNFTRSQNDTWHDMSLKRVHIFFE